MITAAQLRAARGLVDWGRADLSKACGVSQETIKNIEHGIFHPHETTESAIRKAFSLKDVIFTEDDGVKFDRNNIKRYEGPDDFRKFMDDVYITALNDPEARIGGSKPICVNNVDDRLFAQYLGDYTNVHVARMLELKNIRLRVLVQENDFYRVPDAHFIEYRWNMQQSTGDVPFYVYGDKFAILMFNQQPAPQIVVIPSPMVATAYRDQFEILWNNSKKRDDNAKE